VQPAPGFPSEAESALRAQLRQASARCVLTGGQTGVDTLAALAALRAGLPVRVVFPLGFRQEDGQLTDPRRRILSGANLHELASPDFTHRTWACVYLSDAVILIDPAGGAGCQETVRAADHFARPLLHLRPAEELHYPQITPARLAFPEPIAGWLTRAAPQVLMIAGCRASVLAAAGQRPAVQAPIADAVSAFAALSPNSRYPMTAGGL
jgi:hypothetical protein